MKKIEIIPEPKKGPEVGWEQNKLNRNKINEIINYLNSQVEEESKKAAPKKTVASVSEKAPKKA